MPVADKKSVRDVASLIENSNLPHYQVSARLVGCLLIHDYPVNSKEWDVRRDTVRLYQVVDYHGNEDVRLSRWEGLWTAVT